MHPTNHLLKPTTIPSTGFERPLHPINPDDYKNLFIKSVHNKITKTEILEKRSRTKALAMKILFIALAVLGVLSILASCVVGVLTAYAVIPIAATTTHAVMGGLIAGGGLLVSISTLLNFPKNFAKSYVKKALKCQNKASFLKEKIQKQDLRFFLTEELTKPRFANLERIASSSKFAELFFMTCQINDKTADFAKYNKKVRDNQHLIIPHNGLTIQELNEQRLLEQKFNEANTLLEGMRREILELENKAGDIRAALRELDQNDS